MTCAHDALNQITFERKWLSRGNLDVAQERRAGGRERVALA